MRLIWLDFLNPVPPGVRLFRWVMLTLSITTLLVLFFLESALDKRLQGLDWQYQHQKEALDKRDETSKNKDPKSKEEITHARQVLISLNRPWDRLFSALEKSVDKKVGILSVAPDPDKSLIVIKALVPNISSAVEFMERLQASGSFSDVYLTQQEMTEGSQRLSLACTISAHWNM